jgi:hypothetical protein
MRVLYRPKRWIYVLNDLQCAPHPSIGRFQVTGASLDNALHDTVLIAWWTCMHPDHIAPRAVRKKSSEVATVIPCQHVRADRGLQFSIDIHTEVFTGEAQAPRQLESCSREGAGSTIEIDHVKRWHPGSL